MRRLLIFGDSIMKGVIFENGRYHLCRGHDFSFLSDDGIAAENYAKMGATIKTGLSLMQRRLGACDAETTVLLSFGGNDSNFDWARVSREPSLVHPPAVPEEEFIRTYQAAIGLARERGAQVVACTLFPLSPERYFRTISAGNDAAAIAAWLGDKAQLYRWQEYYNALVCRLTRESGCALLDLRASLLRRNDLLQLICDDGIHPTQEGHDHIHRFLSDALR